MKSYGTCYMISVSYTHLLIDYWREIHLREGYQEVSTPVILSRKLWETSGHWDHYKENMYMSEYVSDEKSSHGRGGMISKLKTAQDVANAMLSRQLLLLYLLFQ